MADSNSDILQTGEIGDDEDTHVSEDLGEYDTQDGTATEDSAILNDTNYLEDDADLEAIKLRMKEMEEEARKLREFNSESDDSFNISSANASHLGSPHLLSADEKKEIDGRSIYVGNVDYGATAEELEQHFHGCGSINRVTINCDKFSGHPKGFAYIEFAEPDSIDAAKALDESLFRGRQIKVVAKRTNVPGHSTTNRPPRGRGRGARARGFRGSYRGRSFRGAYRSRGRFNSYYSPY